MHSLDSWSLYASPRHALRLYLISCHGAGEQSGRVPPFTRRSLPTRALVYVSEGRGVYREYLPHQRELSIQAPALIWLAPGVEHGYGPDQAGWTEHWILFGGQSFAAFEDLGLGTRHRPVVALPKHIEGTSAVFAELRSSLGAVGARSEVAASLATQHFFLTVLDAMGDVDSSTDRTTLIDRIARDAVKPLTVGERAREVGVAPRELAETVRASTGLTLNDFVIEVRISRAQALLAETTLDIGRIADLVGYRDPAYFSRIFTRRVGAAPTIFRQQQSRLPPA